MTKYLFYLVLLVVLPAYNASMACAAPAIKEIRLSDSVWGEYAPYSVNSFVFRANGDFYWLEGKSDNVVRHHFSIAPRDFRRLAAAIQKSRFFELQDLYDDRYSAHGPTVTLQVVRGSQTKTVVNRYDAGPSALWELEMLTRGYASRRIASQRASIVKPPPLPMLSPTPTPSPIPVIRGVKSGR